jgi:hypothetical protein
MTKKIDVLRTAANQALAKIIAYQSCGKPDQVKSWRATLDSIIDEIEEL